VLTTLSIGSGVGVPGELGSNVTSFPPASTAVHCAVDGQDTLASTFPGDALVSTVSTGGVPGEVGSNVTSPPFASIAVHCDELGQATAASSPLVSTA